MAAVISGAPGTGISSPSDSLIITSPALSASSLSSSGFDFVNVKQRLDSERLATAGPTASPVTTTTSNTTATSKAGEESSFSDDEIVWNISESEDLNGGTALSDDDFVVLSHIRSSASRPRPKTKTPESNAVGQAGTIRGVPLGLNSELEVETRDMVASELAKEVAKLSVGANDGLVGEASGMNTPVLVEADPGSTKPLKKKGKKAKKERTEEEEVLRRQKKKEKKERKEKEKLEKAAAKELKKIQKEKEAAARDLKKRQEPADIDATPLAIPAPLPPVAAAGPIKSVSTATLVPSSNTNDDHAVLESPKKKKKGKKGEPIATLSPFLPATTSITVEKVSEHTSNPTPYDEAVSYITSYISNPSVHNNRICHLTLLQSLIIELGLLTDVKLLPTSIKSAKKYIKTRVFLNIREYLSKRLEGPQVVKGLMFPSRSALVRDMKRNKNHASLKWVKKRGLQDLLVSVFR